VDALQWAQQGREFTTSCDAIAFGHGLRSETQLADLAGCAFEFDPVDEAWLPRRDDEGRTSVPGVFVAGDGCGIRGADAAEEAGARAAGAALRDLGIADAQHVRVNATRKHERWREAIAVLAQPPRDWAAHAPDDLVVCRCEHVTAGELRACVTDTGAKELNRLKALSRIGMGRCQGRMCGAAAARLLAEAAQCDLRDVGRLRAQPPVKPVPIAALGATIAAASPVPPEEVDD
jgi:NADPH-dependent 2,4-dienoyl-CoA reductase/sulfur reductase-like enzyme